MYARTLVLNFGSPHKVIGWKNAITGMCVGKYIVIKDYPEILAILGKESIKQFPELRESMRNILSVDVEELVIKVPAVVSLRRGVFVRRKTAKFCKTNVCLRDKSKCQYCGNKLPVSRLTFDHVIPRAKGGKTTWDNIVMACRPCNEYKDDRTPEEAGLRLLNGDNHVKKPKFLPMIGPNLENYSIPKEWEEFTITK